MSVSFRQIGVVVPTAPSPFIGITRIVCVDHSFAVEVACYNQPQKDPLFGCLVLEIQPGHVAGVGLEFTILLLQHFKYRGHKHAIISHKTFLLAKRFQY